VELLDEISLTVAEGSLCQLGGSAPNPVLSTVKYFRDEYDAHIRDRRCPGGVCRELITYSINPEKCTGCMRCVKSCTVGAISGERKQAHVIDVEKCIKCGACRASCRFSAVVVS
jgi:ferredoxin